MVYFQICLRVFFVAVLAGVVVAFEDFEAT